MEVAIKVLRVAALLYLGVLLVVYFFQERLIFFPDQVDPGYHYTFSRPFDELYIESDGARLHALRFTPSGKGRPRGMIVYFHGNGGNNRDWGSVAEDFVPYGYEVLVYDYRGYGKSTGRNHSQSQMMTDAEAVYRYARQFYPDEQLVLYGRSLGSGMAVPLAAKHRVKLLVLESPFSSLAGVARRAYPWVPVFLLKYPFPNDVWAAQVQSPVVIVHGTADEVVPYESGYELSQRFKTPVRFVAIEGGQHNNLLSYPAYREAIAQALQ